MMPLQRRSIPSKEDDASENTRQESQMFMQNKKEGLASSKSKRSPLIMLAIANLVFLCFVSIRFASKSASHLVAILVTAQCLIIPILLSLAIGVFNVSSSTLPHQRYIPLAAVGTIVGNLLPSYLSSALANLAIVIFGLSSRTISKKDDDDVVRSQQKSDLLAGPLGTVLAAFVMTTMLLIENFCIWVVSATYKASQNAETLPSPLQDNGQIIMRYFFTSVLEVSKREVVKIRNQINVEWILVSGLGLAIVALEMDGARMKRSLWGVGKRALYTLGIARGIRTFSFLITVLPSQNPRCYFSHFPTPPDEWIPWIMEGFVPQAHGGCNDLIVSGHATVTSTLACMVTSVVGEPLFTAAIWMFVSMDYMVEVYEGFHYSVDMWLGAILVNFIWNTLASVEDSANRRQEKAPKKAFIPLQDATMYDFLKYSLPAIGSYLQLTGIIPNDYANYTIVFYFVAVAYRISTIGFEQYSQHSLICVLFLAIGIYV